MKTAPAVLNSIKFEAKLTCSVVISDEDAEYIIKKHKEVIKNLPKQKAYNIIYLKKVMADYLKEKYPDEFKPAKSMEDILINLKLY